MSKTVIEPVEFKNKSGSRFALEYKEKSDKWKIYAIKKQWYSDAYDDYCIDTNVDIASFKQQSKAVKFCELLKESE